MKVVLAGLAVAVMLLSACGGGSGSTTSDAPPATGTLPPTGTPPAPPTPATPDVTFSPPSISVIGNTDGSTVDLPVTISLSADAAARTDHIEFKDLGGYIVDFSVAPDATKLSAGLVFHVRQLPIGHYAGTISFYLCTDADCQGLVDGAPFVLSYDFTVRVAPPPPPQVSPGSLTVSVEANDTGLTDLSVTAYDRPATVSIGVSDAQGRFATQVGLLSSVAQTQVVRLITNPIAAVGTYTGSLTLFLCASSPCDAGSAIAGSQVSVPYTINVTAASIALLPVPHQLGLARMGDLPGHGIPHRVRAGHLERGRFWRCLDLGSGAGNGPTQSRDYGFWQGCSELIGKFQCWIPVRAQRSRWHARLAT
ncbi:MAG: hypothetical protein WDO12_12305 [Pseudomonadota bacterium]